MLWKVNKDKFSFKPASIIGYSPLFVATSLKGTAKFGSTCLTEPLGEDRWDISKLVGFSAGPHHTNSCRIGWRSIEGKIQLLAYCYYNKKRMSEYITTINVGDSFDWAIVRRDDNWFIYVNGEECIMPAAGPKWGYILNPYFGGTSPAPETMRIILTRC